MHTTKTSAKIGCTKHGHGFSMDKTNQTHHLADDKYFLLKQGILNTTTQ